ncbi:major facilitator superfamily domain-containing protein [Kalaharituber pfeilii]|nr:major facilitator superfamily domain-containing protein [Kalaharituber pfeilii]
MAEKVENPVSPEAVDPLQTVNEPPPNGGLQAWLQVVGSHLVVFVTWGYTTSFGFFQAHYLDTIPGATSSAISWIGSMQLFCLFFVGTFSGALLDMGYFRHIYISGSILLLLGIFMTSLSHSYYQLFLAHGFCVGIANGLLFVPTIAIISTYFTTRRGLVIGITACGSGTGGIIFPIIILKALPSLGFPTTIRILGGVVALFLVCGGLLLRPRIKPRKYSGIIDMTVFQDIPLCIFAVGVFFVFLGLMVPFWFIPTYTRQILPPGSKSDLPTTLIIVLNAAGIPGRLIPGRVADRVTGPFNSLIPWVYILSILQLGWIGVHNTAGIFVFTILYGFFASGVLTLFPATLNSMITDLSRMGIRGGMVCSFVSVACLVGAPIVGALIEIRGGVGVGTKAFVGAQVFAGVMMFAGACLLMVARGMMGNWRFAVKM